MHILSALDVSGTGDTWAGFMGLSSGFTTGGSGRVGVETNGMPTNKYRKVSIIQGVLDLRAYSMLTFTDVVFAFSNFGRTSSDYQFWSDDNAGGLALTTQLNDGAARNLTSAITDWPSAIGGTTEISTRIPFSTAPTGYGAGGFTLNAAGVDYVNRSSQRADHPGYMFFSLVNGGIFDGTTPDLWATDEECRWNIGTLVVTLTYTGSSQPIQINVGDVWKPVTSIQQNVSGSAWSDVTDVDINVSDVWKEAK